MFFKGVQSLSLDDLSSYKATYDYVYKNLKSVKNIHDRKEVAENISLLYMYSGAQLDLESLSPTLNQFKGINHVQEFAGHSGWMGCYASVLDEKDKSKFTKNEISILDGMDKNSTRHTLTHECMHLGSNAIVDDYLPCGLYKKYPMIDEIMTEFYANRVDVLKNELHPLDRIEDKEISLKMIDNQETICAESSGYGNIECFAPMLDSILHNEFIQDKLNHTNELLPYNTMLTSINHNLDRAFSYPSESNYKKLISSFEDLFEYTLIHKTNFDYKFVDGKTPQELLLNDYIPLRQSLMQYGSSIMQRDTIYELDGLVIDLLIPEKDRQALEQPIRQTLESMATRFTTSVDYFEESIGYKLPDYTQSVYKKNDSLDARKSLEDFLDADNLDLIKMVNHEPDSFNKDVMRIKLRMTSNEDAHSIYKSLINNQNVDEHGRNISYILANTQRTNSNFMGIIMQELITENSEENSFDKVRETILKKDDTGLDAFDYAMKNHNLLFVSEFLSDIGHYNTNERFDKDIYNFFKEKEQIIKDNPDFFFNALMYSAKSVYGEEKETVEEFKKNLTNLSGINFNELRDSDGQNFLSFCTRRGFKSKVYGEDSFSYGLKDYSFTTELESVKALLANGFSYLDTDYGNKNIFDTFLARNTNNGFLKTNEGQELFNNIKQIAQNSGEWEDLVSSVSQNFMVKNYQLFDIDPINEKIKGEPLIATVINNNNAEGFREMLGIIKERNLMEPALTWAVAADSRDVFLEVYNTNPKKFGKPDKLKETAILALSSGSSEMFEFFLQVQPETIFKRDKNGTSLFDIYASYAINSDAELSRVSNINTYNGGGYIEKMIDKYGRSEISDMFIKKAIEKGDRTVDLDSPSFKQIVTNEKIAPKYQEQLGKVKETYENRSIKEKVMDFLEL